MSGERSESDGHEGAQHHHGQQPGPTQGQEASRSLHGLPVLPWRRPDGQGTRGSSSSSNASKEAQGSPPQAAHRSLADHRTTGAGHNGFPSTQTCVSRPSQIELLTKRALFPASCAHGKARRRVRRRRAARADLASFCSSREGGGPAGCFVRACEAWPRCCARGERFPFHTYLPRCREGRGVKT